MSGKVISLPGHRLARAAGVASGAIRPLVVSAQSGCVSFVLDDETEICVSPEQAEELAADLTRLADSARAGRRG